MSLCRGPAGCFGLARITVIAVIFVMIASGASRAVAAELVMFESTSCTWCEAWHAEVGIIYDKTDEAKVLPLRLVDVDEERPSDLADIGGIIYTPTFIILEDGKETGRIIGYPGEDFFWQMLGEFVKKVEARLANES